MSQELPNLVDERRFRRREPEQVERDEYGRRKWPEEKIPVDMEPLPGFNLRASVVGQGGMYVKHIQQETRCRVQIKGRGSGFTEHGTNKESDEPMYLHVAYVITFLPSTYSDFTSGPDPNEVQKAKDLCIDLLGNVRREYMRFKENPPPRAGFDRQPQTPSNPYGGYGQQSSGYGSSYGGAQSPTQAAPPGTSNPPGTNNSSSAGTDYAAQYAQYYGGGQDPYAAYGGYQNYVVYYQYWQQQQQQQQAQQDPNAPAPPPTNSEGAPPPPPSGSPPGAGGYNSVRPLTEAE